MLWLVAKYDIIDELHYICLHSISTDVRSYTVSTALNGVISAGSVDVRSYVAKCTILYCEQTAGPRSASFCLRMLVDKEHPHTNFHLNRQRP